MMAKGGRGKGAFDNTECFNMLSRGRTSNAIEMWMIFLCAGKGLSAWNTWKNPYSC